MIPRTEWVEWWRIAGRAVDRTSRSASGSEDDGEEGADDDDDGGAHDDSAGEMVPLIRRGCSWACAPELDGKLVRGWVAATTTTSVLKEMGE